MFFNLFGKAGVGLLGLVYKYLRNNKKKKMAPLNTATSAIQSAAVINFGAYPKWFYDKCVEALAYCKRVITNDHI